MAINPNEEAILKNEIVSSRLDRLIPILINRNLVDNEIKNIVIKARKMTRLDI